MRMTATGLCLALAVALAPTLWGWQGPANAGTSYSLPVQQGGTALQTIPIPGDAKGQLLAVVDPQSRSLAVYQIDAATGTITLRCVRNVTWDLQMLEFNGKAPLPGEIRSLLEQR